MSLFMAITIPTICGPLSKKVNNVLLQIYNFLKMSKEYVSDILIFGATEIIHT